MSIFIRFAMRAAATAAAIVTVVAVLPAPAPAADLSTLQPIAEPMIYNWSGFYAGANFGGAIGSESVSTAIGKSSTDASGVLGGFQAGYNFQFSPAWLLGIEGEFDFTSAEGNSNYISPVVAGTLTSNHDWYSTVAGRIGYLVGPFLLYAKGGGAWMNADYRFTLNSGLAGAQTINAYRGGWTVGTGIEYALAPRWSVKVAYDFLDFGTTTLNFGVPFGAGVTINTQVHEAKLGLNYRWAP